MATLAQISELARPYAETRAELAYRLGLLEQEVMAVRRRHLPDIRKALAKAQTQREKLVNAVAESPGLFDKPKTQIFHGIRLGFQKAKGALTWDDENMVVKLIKKFFPDRANELLKTKEKPVKATLQNLTAAELKRLGVNVVESGEEVVVRPMDSDLDELVDKLLETTATLE